MGQKGKYKYENMKVSHHYDEECCKVVVKSVWNKAKILIWPQKDCEKFGELKTLIHQSVFRDKAVPLEQLPEINDVVIAPYTRRRKSNNALYYRGRVVGIKDEVEGSRLIRIRFIDHLRELYVKMDEMRLPTPEIMEHPIYGIVFKVVGVEATPVTNDEKEILTNRMAQLKITHEDLVEHAVYSGYLWVGPEQTWNDLVSKNPTNPWRSTSSSSKPGPSSSRAGPSSSKNRSLSKNKETVPSLTFKLRSGHRLSENLKNGAQVQIYYVWKVARLTIMATEDRDNVKELDQLIEQYISDKRNVRHIVEIPNDGDIVLAKYSVDHAYYRGRILSVTLNPQTNIPVANVFFIDYGCQENCPVPDLRATTPEIMEHPVYGATMNLDGLPWNPPNCLEAKMMRLSKEGLFILEVVDGNPAFDDLKGQLWFTSEEGNRVNWTDTVYDLAFMKDKLKKGRRPV